MADVTQIHLPTRTTQLEILDKVEFASYVVDINKETYLPIMSRELSVGEYDDITGSYIGVIDDTHIYTFNNTWCYKYDRITLKLVQSRYIGTSLIISRRNRLFADDGDYIYSLLSESNNTRIVKINKLDLTSTTGPSAVSVNYGLNVANRIIVIGDKIVVNTTSRGSWVIDKSTMTFLGATTLNSGDSASDIMYGGDKHPYIYMLCRLAGTNRVYIISWNLTGGIKSAYQSPTHTSPNDNGFLIEIGDEDNFAFLVGTTVFKLDKSTLQITLVNGTTASISTGPFLLYTSDGMLRTLDAVNNGKVTSLIDIKNNTALDTYPIADNVTVSDCLTYNNETYAIVTLNIGGFNFIKLTTLEDIYKINDYRKVDSK